MRVRGEPEYSYTEIFADISFLGNILLFSRMNNDCQCDQVYRHKGNLKAVSDSKNLASNWFSCVLFILHNKKLPSISYV